VSDGRRPESGCRTARSSANAARAGRARERASAVVRIAAAKSEALVAGDDAHGVGSDQGEHLVEGLTA
jgi:hypothetical protein